MTWTLVNSDAVTFADGNTGHVYTFPSGAPSTGDLDILCVNSDTVVSTPTGFTLSTGASRVSGQGAYIFWRKATGGESSSVTVTTSGNFSTALGWSRWQGTSAFDVAANAGVDGSPGTTTPAVSTGTLAGTGELVVALGALHTYATVPTAPSWSSGFTALTAAADPATGSVAAQFTAYKTTAGTTAEAPNVSWTNAATDRYVIAVAFTPAATTAAVPLQSQPRRRAVPYRFPRTRQTGPVRAQVNPPYPTVATRRTPRVLGLLARRARLATPVPAQVVLVAPARAPQPSRSRLRVAWIRSRPTATAPPAQVVVTAPAYPPVAVRQRARALRLYRGHQATPVPPQVTAVPPPFVAGPGRAARMRAVMTRRGRAVAPPVPQAAPPLILRIKLRLGRYFRGRARQPVPPQIVIPPPPYPPQAVRSKRQLWAIRRRRLTSEGWLVGVSASCTTRRPNLGITSRPGAGTTTRPNTGTTEPPCGG